MKTGDLQKKATLERSKGLLDRQNDSLAEPTDILARFLERAISSLSLVLVLGVLLLPLVLVQAHPIPPQVIGGYEVTYFSEPEDPIANSPATLFIQVRNATTGTRFQVYHFLLEMIPPSGPRFLGGHPLSNNTNFVFNQPGNWILVFAIGLTSNLAQYEITVTFVADVSQAPAASLLGSFANLLFATIPRVYLRWGHIFAVVLWLGTMLHVVNTYWVSSKDQEGLSGFARTYRKADLMVAFAIGLLVLTGILRAFVHGLTSVPSLFESDFGLVLFAKISLAAGMIGLGLINRTYLLRKLGHVLDNRPMDIKAQADPSDKRSRVLARTILYLTILEMGLGVSAILFGTIFTQIHTIS